MSGFGDSGARSAVVAGDRFLANAPFTLPRDDYHRVVHAALGLPDPPVSLLAELQPAVADPVPRHGSKINAYRSDQPEHELRFSS